MIQLPEWDSEFVIRSKCCTRRTNLYRGCRTAVVFLVPWILATVPGIIDSKLDIFTIVLFFFTLSAFYVAEQGVLAVKRRNSRRMIFRLMQMLPALVLLCGSCVLWRVLFPGHITVAIGVWWVAGFLLALIGYGARCWALREGILQTKDYKLFGRRVGRSSKRVKHDKASLYQLADKSAEPEIYASPEARRLLDPDQFRSVVAHELGHSWSVHGVSYEVADWIRRMFLLPMLATATTVLLAMYEPVPSQFFTPLFLMGVILSWYMNKWISIFLLRSKERAADLYAVEVTGTPAAFVEAFTKLAHVEPDNVFPNVFDTLALCSHPCTVKRLNHIVTSLETSREDSGRRKAGRRRTNETYH